MARLRRGSRRDDIGSVLLAVVLSLRRYRPVRDEVAYCALWPKVPLKRKTGWLPSLHWA